MAPKRKAAAADTAAQPPTKRVTRNSRRAASVEPQPAPALPKPARGARRSKPVKVVEESDEERADGEVLLRVTRSTAGRGRGGKTTATRAKKAASTAPAKAKAAASAKTARGRATKKATQQRSPSPEVPVASTSQVTIETLRGQNQPEPVEEESEDELLLSPRKTTTPPPPPRTPPRSIRPSPAHRTPRMFLDAVEVPTPSKKMRDIVNIARSPRYISPGKTVASSDKRHLPRDTTPTRALPKSVAKPPSRRVVRPRTPSPEVELEDNLVAEPVSPEVPTPQLQTIPEDDLFVQGAPAALPARPQHQSFVLPSALEAHLAAQKKATLKSLHEISVIPQASAEDGDTPPATNALAYDQLQKLLKGTVERGEGNSCLIVGPKGSGKTQLVERALSSLSEQPIVIRLSGYAQTNDRLAIREIAWQLTEQTGQSLLPTDNDDAAEDDENPFVDHKPQTDSAVTLPPPSHLLALIAMLPTLARPTVIILDAFDLFALHARQSLLYCLLDTVQSCRATAGNKGIAVVGVTMRIETINILEKRVKSRFSGRILRTAGHPTFESWLQAAKDALCAFADVDEGGWREQWKDAVSTFLEEEQVLHSLRQTYSLTRDIRVLSRLMVATITALTPSSPFPSASAFAAAVAKQRAPPRFSFLSTLTYPAVCLLIAAMHARTSGHDAVTFEMLHETFRDQLRVSLSAPVTVDGGGIGMVRCSREVLFGAFEKLVALRVFVATGPTAIGTGREFVKYRCDIDRQEVKNAVESLGQLNLKKWLNKAN